MKASAQDIYMIPSDPVFRSGGISYLNDQTVAHFWGFRLEFLALQSDGCIFF
jgi:hypothetical protein